jgi:hypothetical protein
MLFHKEMAHSFYGGTMFRLSRFVLISLTIFAIAALSACNLGQPAQPTTPTADLTAIGTTVAATVQAGLTLSAPTAAPTLTITPSATSTTETTAGATNTQGIPVEETSAVGSTITPTITPLVDGGITSTPSLTPIGGATAIPSFTPVLVVGGTPSGPVCKDAAFNGDVTIPDGTEMKPWEKFEKVWAIKNTGTCRWDEGFFFAATDGPPSMGKNQGRRGFKTADRFVEPGATAYISIDMYAPGDPGEYVAHWHMFDDNGQPFGGDFTVVIKVVE